MGKKSSLMRMYFPCWSDRVFFLCGVLMLCSEVWKQLVLTFSLGHGAYNWWYFPFQLCSIPMYVLLAYPWVRRESVRRMLLAFLMSFGLLGGIAVFADTSGLMYPLPTLTVHSWAWHFLLILIGISAGAVYFQRLRSDAKNVLFSRALSEALPLRPFIHAAIFSKNVLFSRALSEALPLRPFIHAAIFYLCCCALAEFFNLTLDRYGLINMFYINPDLQMQQVVFRDLVPLIGNLPAILVYIAATAAGAFLFFLVWNLLFRLIRR